MRRNFHGGGATKGTSQTQQHYPDIYYQLRTLLFISAAKVAKRMNPSWRVSTMIRS